MAIRMGSHYWLISVVVGMMFNKTSSQSESPAERRGAYGMLLTALTAPTADAAESVLNQTLMEYLAGDPVINTGSDGQLTQLPVTKPELVAQGAEIYQSHCSSCHGAQLQGQPNWNQPLKNGLLAAPPHDASGHTWHHADDQLYEIVKYGPAVAMQDPDYRSTMPAFGSILSDEQIVAALIFIQSNWPGEQRDWQARANDAQSGKRWRDKTR